MHEPAGNFWRASTGAGEGSRYILASVAGKTADHARRESFARGSSTPSGREVCAVVVTFNPGPLLLGCLEALRGQVIQTVVIDKASGLDGKEVLLTAASRSSFDLVSNSANLGVATAPNQGFRWAIARGSDYVLALDQASQPLAGMVEALLEVYQSHPQGLQVAVAAPRVRDPVFGAEARFLSARAFSVPKNALSWPVA
jgi:GT2 family glycosyltransferase